MSYDWEENDTGVLVPPFVRDDVVSLRPVEHDYLPLLRDWRNSARIRMVTREYRPLNMINQHAWLEAISAPSSRNFMFIVCEEESEQTRWRMVGLVGLTYWQPRDRTAEVSFYIGNEHDQRKGYARRALQLLHRWGFDELGLERIYAEVYEHTPGSVELLLSLGYKHEGILRSHVFRNGRRVDALMLGLLREEWMTDLP